MDPRGGSMSKYRLTIHQDDSSLDMDPLDNEGHLFKLHSFKRGDLHESTADSLDDFADMEGYWLSHYEHGTRHWSIAGTVHYPDMQWDGVERAGFLEVTVSDDEREWWDGRPEADRLEAAKATIAEYTSWINGEVYGYILETLNVCDLGYDHPGDEVEDSCFGFIGWDWFEQAVQETTKSYGATAENTEVVDKAYGAAGYGTFFTPEVANA